jgi:hypothetical protein
MLTCSMMKLHLPQSAHTDAVKSEVSAAVKEDEGHMSAPSSTIDESGMEGVRPVYMNENGSPVSASACLEKFHKRLVSQSCPLLIRIVCVSTRKDTAYLLVRFLF